MAHYQTANTCNIEFLKSSKGWGSRIIKLNYNEQAIPQQLVGRIDNNTWAAFMREVQILAHRHPYVIPPSSKQMGRWAGCFGVGAIFGLFCINPDGGSYPQWNSEISSMLDLWRPTFSQAGCAIALKTDRNSYIQIDIVAPPPSGSLRMPQGKGTESYGQPVNHGGFPQGKKEGYEPHAQQNQQPYPKQQQQQYQQQQPYPQQQMPHPSQQVYPQQYS